MVVAPENAPRRPEGTRDVVHRMADGAQSFIRIPDLPRPWVWPEMKQLFVSPNLADRVVPQGSRPILQ